MKAFRFKNFDIQQSEKVFRVGTDGVLLGALAQIDHARNVLEIGTGTGLISLMLAQRNPSAQFLGIDINEEAALLTRNNFEHSPFRSRLTNRHQDYKKFETDRKFDLIVSNPPYFEASDSSKDKIARQTVELNFLQLISRSAGLLTGEGVFSVIIPYEAGNRFIAVAEQSGLFMNRRVEIRGIQQSKPKRLILEFSLKERPLAELDLTIEKSPRQYSDQYLELTKDFHVFKKA